MGPNATTLTDSEWSRPIGKSLMPWILSLCAVYLTFVRFLRYRHVHAMEREFANSKSKLTPAQAQKILQVPMSLDMPFLFVFAQGYIFFKTYGIPTTSAMIHKTKQLMGKGTGGKRFVDTAVFMSAIEACPMFGPGSGVFQEGTDGEMDPRSAIALARLNWLHSHYKIPNDDYLYDLSLFAFEPMRTAEKYGWRKFTRLERDASYTFWSEIGRRMGIQDIPSTAEELEAWAETYEHDNMVPNETNATVGRYAMDVLLHNIPDKLGLRALGRRLFICLLEERLRKAMMLPEQPAIMKKAVRGLLQFHGFFCGHLCLPRKTPFYFFVPPNAPPNSASIGPNETVVPRTRLLVSLTEPWYLRESTGFWKLLEKLQIATGLATARDFPGPSLQSEGYRVEELGPPHFAKLDHAKIMDMAEKMQGAPIKGPWSLDYAKGSGCPILEPQ